MLDYRKSGAKKYKGFMFDCDGTALDTNPAIFKAWKSTVATFNKDVVLADSDISKYFGRSVPEACEGLIGEYALPGQNIDLAEKVETYWKFHTSNAPFVGEYPGLKAALTELKKRGAKIMMVTSGRHDIVSNELKYFGMLELFDAVIGEEDVPLLKPNPDPALLACKLAGIKPEDALFVGDAPADFASGHRAGCHSCCVPWSVCDKATFTGDSIPDIYLESADELLKLCAF